MRKIYVLMIGEEVIIKSESYKTLIPRRNELKKNGAYICTYLGRIKINGKNETGKYNSNIHSQTT